MPDKLTHFLNNFDYAALLQNTIRIVIILAVAILIWMLIRLLISRVETRMIKRAEERGEGLHGVKQRAETVSSLLRKVIGAIYWVVVALTLLSQIGIDIGALIAGAGVIGLAIAFGAQGLVRDYVTGFFIILENRISAGDVAIVNSTWGTVEELNFRTIILRDLDGIVHIFRHSNVSSLSNATKGWGAYVFKLHVSYKEDTNRVMDIIRCVGEEMKKDETFGAQMLDDMEIHGVSELTDSSVVIRGRFTTTPMNQWATGREFLARIKRAFDEEGISRGVPSRALYTGDGAFYSGASEKPFKIQSIDGTLEQLPGQ